jgi:mediator of RNA polymerase II transcription subunit 16
MSAQDMSLLLDDPMSVDGGMQDMQVIDGLGGMEVLGAMDGMGSMGSAMALDDVDLFGDPVMDDTLAVLPPRARKHLRQRLDELRTRGCCQGIAWSRQGTIASIAKDAMSIELRSIQCNPHTTEWELSKPASWSPSSPLPANPPTPVSLPSSGAPFVHLAWAPTLTPDLAVLDAHGRITVLGFSLTNNQPYPVRRWETDVVDDLHAVVGCYWLPLGTAQNKQVSHASFSTLWPCTPNIRADRFARVISAMARPS